jgi:hypothetical protein
VADASIRLVVPADPDYSRVARTAAAGLALRLGFTYPAIEDLRLAIDEALILLLRPEGPGTSVTFCFEPTEEGIAVDAQLEPGDGRGNDAARRRFERLVAPIVDAWSVDEAADRVHLVKHRA